MVMERLLFTPEGGYEPPFIKVHLHGDVPKSVTQTSVDNASSLIVCRSAKYAGAVDAGSIEIKDMLLFARGTTERCLLILIGNEDFDAKIMTSAEVSGMAVIDEARAASRELGAIAELVIRGLNSIDKNCAYVKNSSGKWLNRGTNFFTLKIQPRKNDIQFTIYGNPTSFDHGGFLKNDQNSYSRGWIGDRGDVARFLKIARESYDRRASR
jgi:hypothetical protein